jgi:hypothetical protein
MSDEQLHVCPHCGTLLETAAQVTYGYCKPKCRDKHKQEVRDKKKIEREAKLLIRQWEEQAGKNRKKG